VSLTENTHNIKSTFKNLKPGLVASYASGLETEWDYSGIMGRDEKARK